MVKSGYDARSEGGEGGEAPEERHRRPGEQLQRQAQNTNESKPERKTEKELGRRNVRCWIESKQERNGDLERREDTWFLTNDGGEEEGELVGGGGGGREGKMDPKLVASSSGNGAQNFLRPCLGPRI